MNRSVLIPILATLTVLCGVAQGQANCTIGQVSGTYATSCSGWITVAPGTTLPAVAIGLIVIGNDNSVTATHIQVVGGVANPGKSTGTVTLNRDCTATLKGIVNDDPNAKLEQVGVFVPHTGEFKSVFTFNGGYPTTSLCKSKRISR